MRRLVPALLTLYVVWGSTYLAIRVLVEEVPPWLGAGLRFGIAGVLLLLIARARGVPVPDLKAWFAAAKAGVLLVPAGNALVCVASQHVPSGLAALVMATVPAQLVLWSWALGGPRPSGRALLGVALGFVGVGVLAGSTLGGPPWAVGVLLVAAAGWSVGSLLLRSPDLPRDMGQSLGMAVLFGGLVSAFIGIALGEEPAPVTNQTWLALAWLVVMGTLVGGSVYTWLLRNGEPRVVASYALVNPVVALLLGALVLGEPLGWRVAVGGAVILLGLVALLSSPRTGAEPTVEMRAAQPTKARAC